jgi:fused signal recognition particle receptor
MEQGMVIIERVAKIVNRLGINTGDQRHDVIAACLILAAIAFILAIYLLMRQWGRRRDDGFDRMGGLVGRLEKLEMTINQFKSDTARSLELFRGDMGFVKQDLLEIKKALSTGEPLGGGGGGAAVGSSGRGGADSEHSKSTLIEAPAPVEPRPMNPALMRTEPLSAKLARTRNPFFSFLKELFSRKPQADSEMLDEIEVQLVSADMGIKTAHALVEEVKKEVANGMRVDQNMLAGIFKMKILNLLEGRSPIDTEIHPLRREQGPMVVMVLGVNGVGKTTTAAKLAAKWKNAGAKVLLVAADTYRAAAVEQLIEWGRRVGVPVLTGVPDAKPATVVFDAMQRAKVEGMDVILIDTAGRLHTKANLMQELQGIKNIIQKSDPTAPHETILILDGTTGTNALAQAKEFNEAVPLTGLVVTKLDGTPKGGIVVAIKAELGIPVRYIGVGESKEDLRPFVARDFAEALFSPPEASLTSSAHAEVRKKRRSSSGAVPQSPDGVDN